MSQVEMKVVQIHSGVRWRR